MRNCAAALAAWTPRRANAQAKYPDRPIKLIVPFAPGGASDVVGRLWADRMKAVLGEFGKEFTADVPAA